MIVDVLAVGAHPDDVELGAGGLIHKWVQRGYTVGILDLTRGEMGTRGTAKERTEEAAEAARILGIAQRENVSLPDGGVANTHDQQLRVIPFIRACRPEVVLATMTPDRHPDHAAAHDLVRDAAYFSGLARIETGHEPWRPPTHYYYHPYTEHAIPSMIVDISDEFEIKLQALRAHASQFHNPHYDGKPTHISTLGFWESIRTRAAYWGSRIGVTHGEALYTVGPLALDSLAGLL